MSNQLTLEDESAGQPVAYPGPEGLPIASTDPARRTAAGYLGVSRRTIYRLLEEGELEGFHVGTRYLVSRASLDAFIARQRGSERDR
jgi:excisionase family DNA binding protein